MTGVDTVGVSVDISELSKSAHPERAMKQTGMIKPYLVTV
jgi:hypothetical protein